MAFENKNNTQWYFSIPLFLMIPTKFMTKFSRSTDLYGKGSVHINSRNLTSHPMRHTTCWYGFKRTEVDQSCFKTFTGLRSGSLKYAPAREFANEIHNYGEHCKYWHVNQAMAKAYPWNKQTQNYPKKVTKFWIMPYKTNQNVGMAT